MKRQGVSQALKESSKSVDRIPIPIPILTGKSRNIIKVCVRNPSKSKGNREHLRGCNPL